MSAVWGTAKIYLKHSQYKSGLYAVLELVDRVTESEY